MALDFQKNKNSSGFCSITPFRKIIWNKTKG